MQVFVHIQTRSLASFVADALGPLGHVIASVDGSVEGHHQWGDVVILDASPRMVATHERIGSIQAVFRGLPLLVLDDGLAEPQRVRALDAGADVILRVPCSPDELIAHVRALGRQRETARRFAAACVLARLPHAPLAALSQREREVLHLLARGHTDQQIASALLIAVRTARFHVGSILRKFAACNRAQAAAYGALLDLLQVEFATAV